MDSNHSMTVMWAIKHWNAPRFYPQTVRRTRDEAWAAFMEHFAVSPREANYDRRYKIHRAVKVAVTRLAP